MSEKEKEILKKVKEALPSMTDYDKGYIVGLAAGRTLKKEKDGETNNKGMESKE